MTTEEPARLAKFFHWLKHDWGRWDSNLDIFQRRYCKICGRRQVKDSR